MIAPQPPPAPSDAPPVWPLVISDARGRLFGPVVPLLLADMAARDGAGRAKHSVPLCPHNGRDFLVDLYQELLDGLAYARGEIAEGDPSGAATTSYPVLLERALAVREALERREKARAAVLKALLDAEATLPADARAWSEAGATVLTSTNLDSLAAVEVAMAIEDLLAVALPDADLQACVTVGDLARVAERAMVAI